MKICLSNNQAPSYLAKAQEISFDYIEREKIVDIARQYPNADMILIHSFDRHPDIDWQELLNIQYIINNRLILGTDSLYICKQAKEKEIKFFFNRRAHNFLEANALKEMGSCYIIPGEPIFFQMEFLKIKGIPIRVIPNLVFLDPLMHNDGVLGTWIRPEDMFMYEKYVDAIEFYSADSDNPLAKERGLYRVYIKNQTWPDNLFSLISNLNYPGNNGLIHSEHTAARLNCGQACQYKSGCKICYQCLNLANPNRMQEILDKYSSYVEETIIDFEQEE